MVRSKIVLLPFPFDDHSGTKLRPVICLTEPIGLHRLLTIHEGMLHRGLGFLPANAMEDIMVKMIRMFRDAT